MTDKQRARARRPSVCVLGSCLCLHLSTSAPCYNPPGRHSCTNTWRGSSRGAEGNKAHSAQLCLSQLTSEPVLKSLLTQLQCLIRSKSKKQNKNNNIFFKGFLIKQISILMLANLAVLLCTNPFIPIWNGLLSIQGGTSVARMSAKLIKHRYGSRTRHRDDCTSMTATPAQIPKITPQFSRSHFSTLVIQPCRRERDRVGGPCAGGRRMAP